ncbi:PARP3, partial [Symbiodinium sp. KB8]
MTPFSGDAFAALQADGSLRTWGSQELGGDDSSVRDQLQDVQKVVGTAGAFAAILADGRVITWGDAESGGDSDGVQDQLCD